MARIFGLVGLVIALAVGWFLYSRQAQSVAPAGNVKAAVDVTGVKNDLLAFANAEKQEFALDGAYLPLDELRAKGVAIPGDQRGPYRYSAEIGSTGFRIVATNVDGAPGVPRAFSVDEGMQVRSEE